MPCDDRYKWSIGNYSSTARPRRNAGSPGAAAAEGLESSSAVVLDESAENSQTPRLLTYHREIRSNDADVPAVATAYDRMAAEGHNPAVATGHVHTVGVMAHKADENHTAAARAVHGEDRHPDIHLVVVDGGLGRAGGRAEAGDAGAAIGGDVDIPAKVVVPPAVVVLKVDSTCWRL